MSMAAKKLSHMPLVLLYGVPPLLPHKSLPSRWPASIQTAAILSQKVLAIQGPGPESPSYPRHSPAAP